MTIIAEDNFTRASTASGWGTSTNSASISNFAWSNDGTGLTGVHITASNQGQISDSASRYCLLDDGTTRQVQEIVVECKIDNTADTFGALACWHGTSGVGTDWYLARYDGSGHIVIMSRKSNTNTTQATAAFTITTTSTYRIRFNITLNGSSQPFLQARIWDVSGAEPGTWNVNWTDTGTAVAAGHSGAYGFADTSLSHKALYTFYSLDNLALAPRTVPATADLTSTYRQVPGTSALLATLTRTVPATAEIVWIRTVTADSALLATLTRTVSATGNLAYTRTFTADSALLATLTRTVSSSGNLGLTRNAPASSALLSTLSRTVPATAAVLGGERIVPVDSALLSTLSRTVPATGAVATVRFVSETAALQATLTRTIPETAALLSTLQRTVNPVSAALLSTLSRTLSPCSAALGFTRTVPEAAVLLSTLTRTVPASAVIGTAGTGIGGLTVGSHSQAWTGVAGSPGTATDINYTDSTGSGWTVSLIPTYGGANIASWYQVDSNNGPDGSGAAINQHSLSTTTPDGWTHLFTDKTGNFVGSEDFTYSLNEQAPAGTDFRRFYLAQKTSNDANGFQWNVWSCIYPGDPGLIVDTIAVINTGGSAVGLAGADGMELALIAGLEQTDSTWSPANGGYGNIGGSNTVGWPATAQTTQPDYVYILPNAAGINLGAGAVKAEDYTTLTPAWGSPQLQYLQSSSRLKLKLMGTVSSFPAGTTETFHVLRVLKRNLTSGIITAIAADYLSPGTPVATVGSYTLFDKRERAFVFAAGTGNNLSATLDMSPANVTVRYKPIIKVTGWNGVNTPTVTWGGSSLVNGQDFRYTIDTVNNTLYLQLYYDVVSSGAAGGQRNNATLVVSSPLKRQVTVTAALLSTLSRTIPETAALQGSPTRIIPNDSALISTLSRIIPNDSALISTLPRSIPGSAALISTLPRTVPESAALISTLSRIVPASTVLSVTLSRTVPESAALISTLSRIVPASAVFFGSPTRTVPGSAAFQGGFIRNVPGSSALQGTAARLVPGTAAFNLTLSRIVLDNAALQGTQSRQVSASAILVGITTRILPLSGNLTGTFTRSIPIGAIFSLTPAPGAIYGDLLYGRTGNGDVLVG